MPAMSGSSDLRSRDGSRDPSPAPDAKRLIFAITTGRSGTEYLARVLALFAGVRARHEPRPRFSSCFRAVQAVPSIAREFWVAEKLPAIARETRPIYAETSHLACKGFLESLVELGGRPDLVHLRRDPRAVARSLWSLRSIPGRSLRGVRYYLGPQDRVHLSFAPTREPNDYQLAYWYCLEIEARAAHYRRAFEPLGVRVHAVDLESIRTAEGIETLGRALDLGSLSTLGRLRLATIGARVVNAKSAEKRPARLPEEELDAWEAEVRAWAGLASEPARAGQSRAEK